MLYNIPAGVSFVDELAKGILERWDCDNPDFCKILILLPSRRACSALRDAFLRQTDGKPLLLPKIYSIANIEEEFFNIPSLSEFISTLSPAISAINKKVELAKLICKAKSNIKFDQALSLADDLAVFLDEITIYDIDKDNLDNLAPDDLANHWQEILQFIKIVSANWNDFLMEKGFIDSAYRQKIILEHFIKGINNYNQPIIIAGQKNYTPQIAGLLKMVNELDNGFVIFPAMEREEGLPPTHPQYSLNRLFESF